MSPNRFKPHLLIIPEDDANLQIANGFTLNPNLDLRVVQILSTARGWTNVLKSFTKKHIPKLNLYKNRMLLLLIDFDKSEGRLKIIQNAIPDNVRSRVFVLGARSDPESLRREMSNVKGLEGIGMALAQDCVRGTYTAWEHPLLEHNKSELDRMYKSVRPFLFPLVTSNRTS